MIKQEELVKLLGRDLSPTEIANYDLYLNNAVERLEDLLCIQLCGDEDDRVYETRSGYRTVYVDPFTDIDSVTVDGEEVDSDNYVIKQNNRFFGSWYNIIEFSKKQRCEKITVSANWGFKPLPIDLATLLAKLFAQGSVEQKVDNTVKTKEIEDFKVTYKDGATFEEFTLANSGTIAKYAQCDTGTIRQGRATNYYGRFHTVYN